MQFLGRDHYEEIIHVMALQLRTWLSLLQRSFVVIMEPFIGVVLCMYIKDIIRSTSWGDSCILVASEGIIM